MNTSDIDSPEALQACIDLLASKHGQTVYQTATKLILESTRTYWDGGPGRQPYQAPRYAHVAFPT